MNNNAVLKSDGTWPLSAPNMKYLCGDIEGSGDIEGATNMHDMW